jgi:formylglycine-generating enzyme
MSDIFISYANEDRARAAALAKCLQEQGWSVWWDRQIRTGQDIEAVIEREIGQTRCMIVLWSAISVRRPWVRDEAREGNERGILLPVKIEDVKQPLGFRNLSAGDLSGWKGECGAPVFRQLCSDIEALIGAPGTVAQAAGDSPTKPWHRFVTEWMAAPRPSRRRWAFGLVSLAVLACAGYLVSKLPIGNKTASPGNTVQRPAVQANPNEAYVRIEPGTFQMGATPGDTEPYPDEKPRHPVRITKGFWIGATPVTVADYKRFVGQRQQFKLPPAPDFNPDWGKPDHPIVNVTWDEAKAYCEWDAGRLPTEAEWEYAARGGKDGLKYPWGNDITPENANYSGSKWHGTSPVRSYTPNAWGLYDMAGNVWEWVADWYDERYYASSPSDDPRGPQSRTVRVLRGGSFVIYAWYLRAAYRNWDAPGDRLSYIGFRCVREVVP